MQVLKPVLVASLIAVALPVFAAETSTLTDAQRDEVRALVKEVMSDADSRATLASGATAGIDENGKVFLKTEDSQNYLNVSGSVQFRYMYNNEAGKVGSNSADHGFDVGSTQIDFSGYVGSPRVTYDFLVGTNIQGTSNSGFGIENAIIGYQVVDQVIVSGGKFTAPYSRESLIGSRSQIAVTRSATNDFFGLGYVEGAQVQWSDNANVRVRGAITNGGGPNSTSNQPYHQDAKFAATGRADFLMLSSDKVSFESFNDNGALTGNQQGLLVGAAAYYEYPSDTTLFSNRFGATVDATFKMANVSFAVAGFYASQNADTHNAKITAWGLVGTLDVALTNKFDVFAQYNFINDGTDIGATGTRYAVNGSANHAFQEVSVGASYKVNSHVKVTGDVGYVFQGGLDATNPATYNNGAGLAAPQNPSNEQFLARLQVQVGF